MIEFIVAVASISIISVSIWRFLFWEPIDIDELKREIKEEIEEENEKENEEDIHY